MDVRFDFNDIEDIIGSGEGEILERMRAVADEGVQYAKENGDYRDVTGLLRRSCKSRVTRGGIELLNDAPYASSVEARGKDVLSGAALYVEQRLKEMFE